MGQRPRWFKPDTVYEQTQRTVDRQFLFAPIPGVRNAIGASAARALQKHPVKLYWLEVNSNHEHLGIGAISPSKEHLENLVHFKRTYHRLLAEEINRLHDRSGAIFSSPARTTECLDDESSEAQMFYALLNPVKDNLVERVEHWQGFSSFSQCARGVDEVYTYYDRTAYHKQKHRPDAKSIEAFLVSIRLEFSRLPHLEHLSEGAYQTYLRREVKHREQTFEAARNTAGCRVLGKERLKKTDPRQRPANPKPSGAKPICHCVCDIQREKYKEAMKDFCNRYIQASVAYRSGAYKTEFPTGSIRPSIPGISV
jgi:REP element-mobilizing transposase RayT